MENASKALLIAAAVLVVIVLIAFGMSVLNSSGEIAESANTTGSAINKQTSMAANAANEILEGFSEGMY